MQTRIVVNNVDEKVIQRFHIASAILGEQKGEFIIKAVIKRIEQEINNGKIPSNIFDNTLDPGKTLNDWFAEA